MIEAPPRRELLLTYLSQAAVSSQNQHTCQLKVFASRRSLYSLCDQREHGLIANLLGKQLPC